MILYNSKRIDYYSACRLDLLELIPKKHNNRILEIGTGRGDTLIKAKELGLAEEVVGIDMEKVENNIQSESKMFFQNCFKKNGCYLRADWQSSRPSSFQTFWARLILL